MKLHAFLAFAIAIVLTERATIAAPADRGSVSIAAAANFVYALDALNAAFKRVAPTVKVTSTTGASGALFAQIKYGAPFDVFLSADTEYPQHVVEAGLADRSTLQIFATGRLVAWTTRTDIDVANLAAAIRAPRVRKIAIAQPRAAPYGRAAQATLKSLGVWDYAEPKLVMGESVTQTAQFVETGNADLGIVALSLVVSPKLAHKGRWSEISPDSYQTVSLDHAAVLLRRGSANPDAKRYLEFLRSEAAKKILRDFGYAVPELKSSGGER
jgi:molybdate transport system substrate-binding protein